MKKIAVITLVAVLAISSVGVGLAKWFDTITIDGTVDTAGLDLVLQDYSGTWVYKTYDDPNDGNEGHGSEYFQGWKKDYDEFMSTRSYEQALGTDNQPQVPASWASGDGYMVAFAEARDIDTGDLDDDDDMVMEFANLYPIGHAGDDGLVVWRADVLWKYEGNIPAQIDNASITYTDDVSDARPFDLLETLMDQGLMVFDFYRVSGITFQPEPDAGTGAPILPIGIDVGDPANYEEVTCHMQLHNGDYLYLAIEIDIPQTWVDGYTDPPTAAQGLITKDLMNLSSEFMITFDVVQWDAADQACDLTWTSTD